MIEKPTCTTHAATQVKITVSTEVANAFKITCKSNNISMTAVLSDFMCKYSKTATPNGYAPNLSMRRQRKAATQAIICQLERIRANEENYRDNIPANLSGGSGYEAAEQCISILDEALDLLASAY